MDKGSSCRFDVELFAYVAWHWPQYY